MKKLLIAHLYAKEMNIYGDNGNVLVLKKRLEWRDIPVKVVAVGVGDTIPKEASIIIGGGGQDTGQLKIAKDLKQKKDTIKNMHKDGVVMLMICGMYQLFGHYFDTNNSQRIAGIGLFDSYTVAGSERIIGNCLVSSDWGNLIGYENHSGKTYLNSGKPLGYTKIGQGNNTKDKTEGAYNGNAFGSYLHGPLLAKAPIFADYLLQKALEVSGYTNKLVKLNDEYIEQAIIASNKRPR